MSEVEDQFPPCEWEANWVEMAADPQLQKELDHINSEFGGAESDGLGSF